MTKVDLPGMNKEDVKVEVTDGHLAISGERKRETEEKTEKVYRSEREYGSFYRAVPLPDGAKLEDVKATFADGVLEVSVPMPAMLFFFHQATTAISSSGRFPVSIMQSFPMNWVTRTKP